jgi:hypothetical protein
VSAAIRLRRPVARSGQCKVPDAIRMNAIKIDQAFNSISPELDRYNSLVQKSGWTFKNDAERDAVQ